MNTVRYSSVSAMCSVLIVGMHFIVAVTAGIRVRASEIQGEALIDTRDQNISRKHNAFIEQLLG